MRTLLYFPPRKNNLPDEIEQLSQEIEQLVQVCRGHALALFTSYDQMGRVQQNLQGRLAYPLLTARRNGQVFVQVFKQLSNAVLFAAGPCWEGVDFPGDRVSLLASPVRTHHGAKFNVSTVNKILRDRQYLGYLITKDITSPHLPELQIIDEALFNAAQEITEQRKTQNAAWRNIPRHAAF